MKHLLFAACLFVGAAANAAPVLAPAAPLAAEFKQYVRVPGGRIALTHVRVIDGTGAAPVEDQTLLIDGARIAAVQAAPVTIPPGYTTLDLTGASVMPGMVGMHNHLFYLQRPNIDPSGHFDSPIIVPQ